MVRTAKHFSFLQLTEEAFGELGLHPWEFYRYTLQEYVARRTGHDKARRKHLRQEFQHVQIQAYYSILPYLSKKDQRKSISELIPDIYNDKPTTVVNLKEWYESLKEKYRKAGVKL